MTVPYRLKKTQREHCGSGHMVSWLDSVTCFNGLCATQRTDSSSLGRIRRECGCPLASYVALQAVFILISFAPLSDPHGQPHGDHESAAHRILAHCWG